MSDQELDSMMNVANVESAPVSAPDVPAAPATNEVAEVVNETAPATDVAAAKVEAPSIKVGDCTSVYDFVAANTNLTVGWKKVNLVGDNNTVITDCKNVLVGVNDAGVPVAFDCNNLYIPTVHLNGVTAIKVLISGIIISQPNADIYVTKNNVYVYEKDAATHARVKLTKYLKVKKDNIYFAEVIRDASRVVDAEYTKFVIKATGGRLYTLIEDLTDLAAMKEAVLKFLAEKVTDINYCIKIEDICLQLGF